MLRKRDLTAVVADLRLTPAALRLVLHVALKGDGEYEIPQSQLRTLLGHCSEKTLRETTSIAVDSGWLGYRKGGRDHHNAYWFVPVENAGSSELFDPVKTAGSNGVAENSRNGHDPANFTASKFDPTNFAGSSALARVSDDHPDTKGEGEEEGRFEFLPETEELFFDLESHLKGCRGALRDYLEKFVQPKKQYGYLRIIQMALNGTRRVFTYPDGLQVPEEDRTRLLAIALNELSGGSEETMAGRVGDVRNLLTKLSIVIKQEWESTNEPAEYRSGRNGAARAAAGQVRGSEATGYEHLG